MFGNYLPGDKQRQQLLEGGRKDSRQIEVGFCKQDLWEQMERERPNFPASGKTTFEGYLPPHWWSSIA